MLSFCTIAIKSSTLIAPSSPLSRERTPTESISVPKDWKVDRAFFSKADTALRAFFEKGKPLPRLTKGAVRGSGFQQKVWDAVDKIPFGETRSYGEIAGELGTSEAVVRKRVSRGLHTVRQRMGGRG